jgi:hypothetical protein
MRLSRPGQARPIPCESRKARAPRLLGPERGGRSVRGRAKADSRASEESAMNPQSCAETARTTGRFRSRRAPRPRRRPPTGEVLDRRSPSTDGLCCAIAAAVSKYGFESPPRHRARAVSTGALSVCGDVMAFEPMDSSAGGRRTARPIPERFVADSVNQLGRRVDATSSGRCVKHRSSAGAFEVRWRTSLPLSADGELTESRSIGVDAAR